MTPLLTKIKSKLPARHSVIFRTLPFSTRLFVTSKIYQAGTFKPVCFWSSYYSHLKCPYCHVIFNVYQVPAWSSGHNSFSLTMFPALFLILFLRFYLICNTVSHFHMFSTLNWKVLKNTGILGTFKLYSQFSSLALGTILWTR